MDIGMSIGPLAFSKHGGTGVLSSFGRLSGWILMKFLENSSFSFKVFHCLAAIPFTTFGGKVNILFIYITPKGLMHVTV